MQLKKNRGVGTIHLIIIFAMILAITASGAAIVSIISQSLNATEESLKSEVDINNLFVFVDIIMRQEVESVYEKTQEKILSDRVKDNISVDMADPGVGMPYSEEEKIKFIKVFSENAKDIRVSVDRAFEDESFYFNQMFGLKPLYSKIEILYYDSRKGKEQFVPLGEFGNILYPDNIKSSADISIGVRLFAKNEEKENMEYIKYYYFDFDDKLESGEMFESKEDLIHGAIYYVKAI